MASPAWGSVMVSSAWHVSPHCPRLKDSIRRAPAFVAQYEDADHAFKTGHNEPCGVCAKLKFFEDEEIGMVHLTVEQIDTLHAIKKVYGETGKPMTLSQIADVRKRKVSTCFRIVATLADKGLVLKKKGRAGGKAVNAGIAPSAAGSRILAKMIA